MWNIMEMRFFIERHVIQMKHYYNMVKAFTYNCLHGFSDEFEKPFNIQRLGILALKTEMWE